MEELDWHTYVLVNLTIDSNTVMTHANLILLYDYTDVL